MRIEDFKEEARDLASQLDDLIEGLYVPQAKSAHIDINLMGSGVEAGYFVDGKLVSDLEGMLISLAQGVPGVSAQSCLKVIHGISKNVTEYCEREIEARALPENNEYHED